MLGGSPLSSTEAWPPILSGLLTVYILKGDHSTDLGPILCVSLFNVKLRRVFDPISFCRCRHMNHL
jgi:hypothetical protein